MTEIAEGDSKKELEEEHKQLLRKRHDILGKHKAVSDEISRSELLL